MQEFWTGNAQYWIEKLRILNDKYMALTGEFQIMSSTFGGSQNFQNYGTSFPNDLDLVIRGMKKSLQESEKFSNPTTSNSEEPLDLSVKK